jgi:hypothetical protein
MSIYVIKLADTTLTNSADLIGPFSTDECALDWIDAIDPDRICRWHVTECEGPETRNPPTRSWHVVIDYKGENCEFVCSARGIKHIIEQTEEEYPGGIIIKVGLTSLESLRTDEEEPKHGHGFYADCIRLIDGIDELNSPGIDCNDKFNSDCRIATNAIRNLHRYL